MNTIGFATLLKTKTPRVYADFVPEKKQIPAIAFTHIANGGSRVLKGNRSGLWDTWRILIVGSNRTESEALQKELESLDNTSSPEFKNILVMATGGIPALPDDKTRTAFIDIKTYG